MRRILQAKARLELNKSKLVDLNAINEKFGRAPWQKEAQDISDRGVTLLRDTANRLPLDAAKPSRALLLAFYADPEPYPGEDLERELRSRFDSRDYAARRHAFRESGHAEIAARRYLRRCDSRAVRARERSQGKCRRVRRSRPRSRNKFSTPASR